MKKTLINICCILGIFSVFSILGVASSYDRATENFNKNCVEHLERAADTSSVETAKKELEEAIFFVEARNLTQGTTSIFFNKPENDIGYWYQNLKACYKDLERLPENLSSSEKKNALAKLRKGLLNCSTTNCINVKVPEHISLYPNGIFYYLWLLFSIIGVLLGAIASSKNDESFPFDDDWT